MDNQTTNPAHAEDLGGLKGACPGCPFNEGLTDEASRAQNYGCLPTAYDIIRLKRDTGHNWACHDNENATCAGLCHSAKEQSLDLSKGNLVRYSSWYHAGEEAAIEEANTGILYLQVTGPVFNSMLEGRIRTDGTVDKPTVAPPTLMYFSGSSARHHGGPQNPDERTLFLALGQPTLNEATGYMLRPVLGAVGLEQSPFEAKESWLSFVTVDPAWQSKGIARKLLTLMAGHLVKKGDFLKRSFATDEGRRKVQDFLDQLLDDHGIAWSQSGREPELDDDDDDEDYDDY